MAAALSKTLIDDVLAGRVHAIARMMTWAETQTEQSHAALPEIYRHTGQAHVVGLTGVPGSGKSTLLQLLVPVIRRSNRKVGIIAVDPSSPFSGGAILGDRVRMTELASDPGVFIRSMATHGSLGGIAKSTLAMVDILDAAGFDLVLVETVGVGQDEVDIVRAAHTVVVITAPGLGDEIQAIKAGVLEIADVHVVSKCDRSDANKTLTELKSMLALDMGDDGPRTWQVPVLATSAEKREGIEDLASAIEDHRRHLEESGEIKLRRRRIIESRVLKTVEDIVRSRFAHEHQARLAGLLERVMERELDPYTAASRLLRDVYED